MKRWLAQQPSVAAHHADGDGDRDDESASDQMRDNGCVKEIGIDRSELSISFIWRPAGRRADSQSVSFLEDVNPFFLSTQIR